MVSKIRILTFTVAIAFLIFFISNISFGQEAECKMNNNEVRGYLMLGYTKFDIDDLNDRLMSKGNTSFSDDFYSIGGGFLHQSKNNWLFGFEGHFMFCDEKDYSRPGESYKASLMAANGFFDIGYSVVSSEGLNIYPLIGVGGGATWLEIGKKNFDDILDTPQGNASLTAYNFMFNFAIGTDYLIKIEEKEKNEAGLVLGVRAGYFYAPWNGDWWSDNINITSGPNIGMTGPYIRFMIGFGGKGNWWDNEKD